MTEYLISDELLTSIRQACYNAGKAGKEVFTVKAPSVEIVRCGECKMADLTIDVWCELFEVGVLPDHFCKAGKRREDA